MGKLSGVFEGDRTIEKKERSSHGTPGRSGMPASAWEVEVSNEAVRAGLIEKGAVEQRLEISQVGITEKNILGWWDSWSKGPKAGWSVLMSAYSLKTFCLLFVISSYNFDDFSPYNFNVIIICHYNYSFSNN